LAQGAGHFTGGIHQGLDTRGTRQKKPNVDSEVICSLQFHKGGCNTNSSSSFALVRRNKGRPEEVGKRSLQLEQEQSPSMSKPRSDRDASRNWLEKSKIFSQSPPKLLLMDCKEINLSKNGDCTNPQFSHYKDHKDMQPHIFVWIKKLLTLQLSPKHCI